MFVSCICLYVCFTSRLAMRRTASEALLEVHCRIWRVLSDYLRLDESEEPVQWWVVPNKDCQNIPESADLADNVVQNNRSVRVVRTFLKSQSPVIRADHLRYIILEAAGRIVNDADSTLIPVNDHIPP